MTRAIFSFVLVFLLNAVQLHAEGSVDFIDYPGHRLFLRADKDQQIKVYAEAGEFLNFGASHVGFDGGLISVYRPDGTLHQISTGSNGEEAIIFNSTQEANGAIGASAGGYTPGIIPVTNATEGIWSLVFTFTEPSTGAAYQNLLNNAPWTRAEHQPTNRRVILSWDVTVSKNNSLPNGGESLSGRVFTNEYNSMISQNGTTTSPRFYVLTNDGLQYSMDFMETDPFGFPISSSSLGLLNADQSATYQSWAENILIRSDDPTSWVDGNIYQYDPQAEDYGNLINNKIFFNTPDSNMPTQAVTTDIFHSNTHTTWLYNEPMVFETVFNSFEVVGVDENDSNCALGDLQTGQGAHFIFDTNIPGSIQLKLDLNNDGDTEDDTDIILTGMVNSGLDSIFWDGNDGLGNPVPPQDGFEFSYAYELRGGENHIMLSDVENNTGGIVFELLSDIGADATDNFYYDHTPVDGPVSGGGTPGNALPTNVPFTYDALFGNKKMLDYWAYVTYEDTNAGTIVVNIIDDCTPTSQPDSDGDGIDDTVDLDDDNDGISDLMEHCLGQGFACLPGGLDPSGDNDDDGIANYQDANDAAVNNNCTDINADGICDDLAAIYDTDADGVPDHLDLDSDNDGISDLYEANHGQLDMDNNGMIDGANAEFGANGFFNILASDPDAFDAVSVYQPLDHDGDGIIDADDLDSDNDGINDVEEAGHTDLDNDGLIDNSPVGVDVYGVAISLNGTLPLPLDTDNDTIPDFHDLDTDNDGINDVVEGGNADPDNDGLVGTGNPTVNENGQANEATSNPNDTDNDEIADYRDLDADNDGINDLVEGGNDDEDNDGIIGTGTPVVNDDGQANGVTSNPDDTDGDNLPDYHDLDSDNDGINDVIEGGNGDEDNDGIIGTGTPIVNDNGQANGATSNPDDTDGDNIPDYHDLDSDNDGINDVVEGGNADEDNDGIVGTGIPTVNDNGQGNGASSNPDDTDGDNIPDYHDLDSDNDGINDVVEGGNADEDNDGIIGTGTPIVNDNGQANGASSNPDDTDGDNIPDYHDLDSDNDGINDVVEGGNEDEDNDGIIGTGTPIVNDNGQANGTTSNPNDTDGDNIPDYHDLDSDNDGINDVEEGGNEDPDNDGVVGIGIPNVNENGQADSTTSDPTDTDMDGIPDYHDLDSDSDGISDVIEGGNDDPDGDGIVGTGIPDVNDMGQPDGSTSNPPDTDLDGIPDYQEPACNGADITITSTTGGGDYCAGDAIVLTATTNVTEGNLSFIWTASNGSSFSGEAANDADLTWVISPTDVDVSGTYTLVATTEEGCIASSNEVVVNVTAIPSQPEISIDNVELCAGEDLSLSTAEYSGQNVVYQWFMDQELIGSTTIAMFTIENTTVENSGEYSVVIADEDCVSPSSNPITVTVTAAITGIEATNNTSADNVICAGGDVVLSVPTFENTTVEWFGPNGSVGTDFELTLSNVTEEEAGEYYAMITFDICGETSSSPTTVFISDNNITPVLGADNDEICAGENVELSVINDLNIEDDDEVNYTWFNSANEQIGTSQNASFTLENLTTSEEYYVVVSINGCTANSENYFISVNALPNETANIPQEEIYLCDDEMPLLQAVAGIESTGCWTSLGGAVILNPNDNTTEITLLEEGANQFVWTLKDEFCGAFSSDTITIHSATTVQAFDDVFTTEQNENTFGDLSENDNISNVSNYEYAISNAPAEGSLTLNEDGTFEYFPVENFTGIVEFSYTVCNLVCPDDCEAANVSINYQNLNFTDDCFVPNGITPNGDGANDALEIPCLNNDAHPNNHIMIFNRWGDKVHEENGYKNDWFGTYKEKTLPAGTYFYILMIEPGTESIQDFFSIVY